MRNSFELMNIVYILYDVLEIFESDLKIGELDHKSINLLCESDYIAQK